MNSVAVLFPSFEAHYLSDHAREHALLLDAVGKIVVQKVGTIDRVDFTPDELVRACYGYLTHIHPHGKPPSQDDLVFAAEHGLRVLRAVGSTPDGERYEYTVTMPTASAELAQAIGYAWEREFARAYSEVLPLHYNNWKTEREARHLTIKRLAQQFHFGYERIQRGVQISEMRRAERRRLDVLAGVNGKMRSEVLLPLRTNLVSGLTKLAEPNGMISPAKLNAVRDAVNRSVTQVILGRPQADGTYAPYNVVNDEVVPRSMYFKALWDLMRGAAQVAVEQQAAIMRKYMPADLLRLYTMATLSPFDTQVTETDSGDDDAPILDYDPLHRWLGSDGKELSDRIWNVAGDMRRKLDQYLAESIAQRKTVQQMARELEQYLAPDRQKPEGKHFSYEAMRLARTETAAAHSRAASAAAQMNPFVETYSVFTAPEHGCCDECDVIEQGSPYPKDDTTHLPPFHPNCICGVLWNVVEKVDEVARGLRKRIEDAIAAGRKAVSDVISPLSKRFLNLLFRGRK